MFVKSISPPQFHILWLYNFINFFFLHDYMPLHIYPLYICIITHKTAKEEEEKVEGGGGEQKRAQYKEIFSALFMFFTSHYHHNLTSCAACTLFRLSLLYPKRMKNEE